MPGTNETFPPFQCVSIIAHHSFQKSPFKPFHLLQIDHAYKNKRAAGQPAQIKHLSLPINHYVKQSAAPL